MMVLVERLIEIEWGHIQLCGLEHIHKWPDLREHLAHLSVQIEWWHIITSRFHLPIREEIITLLDVWWILRVSIHSRYVEYVLEGVDPYLSEYFGQW